MPSFRVQTVVSTSDAAVSFDPKVIAAKDVMDRHVTSLLAAAGGAGQSDTRTVSMLTVDCVMDVPEGEDDAQQYIARRLGEQGLTPLMGMIIVTPVAPPKPAPQPNRTAGEHLAAWMGRLPTDADPKAVTRVELWHMTGVNGSILARLTSQGKITGKTRAGTWFYDMTVVAEEAADLREFNRPVQLHDRVGPNYRKHVPAILA